VDIPAYVLELPAPRPAFLLARQGETRARLIERTGRHIE
jgi:hypothetical protein